MRPHQVIPGKATDGPRRGKPAFLLCGKGLLGHCFFMGLAYAKIQLENPKRSDLQPMEVNALADTGSLYLCIPESVQLQLQLEATSQKAVTTADGKRSVCDYVGPVRIKFENRECYVGAVVLGDEVLLGAVPMEDMDLVVVPPLRRVMVNPLHPNFAEGPAKGHVIS